MFGDIGPVELEGASGTVHVSGRTSPDDRKVR
jgi:hypothetical protein